MNDDRPPSAGGYQKVGAPFMPCNAATGADLGVEVRRVKNHSQPVHGATVEASGPGFRKGTTDKSGDVLFQGIQPGPYQITATKKLYTTASDSTIVSTESRYVTLYLEATCILEIFVRDKDTGNGIPTADVEVSGPEKEQQRGHTDAQGIARFTRMAPGIYFIAVDHADYIEGRVTATADQKFTRITVDLSKLGAVTGYVKDGDTGKPVAGALLALDNRSRYSARTDAQGKYTIHKVPPGAHRITVSKTHYPSISDKVSVPAGKTVTKNFTLKATCSDPLCPFRTWEADCRAIAAQLNWRLNVQRRHEFHRQVRFFIYMQGRWQPKPKQASAATAWADNRKAWGAAVGGWTDFDRAAARDRKLQRSNAKALDQQAEQFLYNKIGPLVSHVLQLKAARADGSRWHTAQQCTDAFTKIPAQFLDTPTGAAFAKRVLSAFHAGTTAQQKTDEIARFMGSNTKGGSVAELLDSTVFESTLEIMDRFAPVVGVHYAKHFKPVGFVKYLAGKQLVRGHIGDYNKAPRVPTSLVRSAKHKAHIPRTKIVANGVTIARADTLHCQALSGVLNTLAFLSAWDELDQKRSATAALTTVKNGADLMASIAKSLGSARRAATVAKRAGHVGLALDAVLSGWEAGRAISMSTTENPQHALVAAHVIKGVGAAIMIGFPVVGAVVYLVGTVGVVILKEDPFIAWAKYTRYGIKCPDKRRRSSAKDLKTLHRLIRADGI